MATVNVSSWAEFAQAVTVSGDTVVCPENAVWDFNDLYPDGFSSTVIVNAFEINGNGTTIKNAHTSGQLLAFGINYNQTLNGLHIENFICESGSIIGVSSAKTGRNLYANGCRFSGILPTDCNSFCSGKYKSPHFTSCSFALDCPTTGAFKLGSMGLSGDGDAKYCRIHIQLPNATGSAGFNQTNCTWCKINIDQPGVNTLYVNGAIANVYGGDMPSVVSISGTHGATYISIFDSDTIQNLVGSAYLVGVTDAQMKDAAYLSSIGFPIGVEA